MGRTLASCRALERGKRWARAGGVTAGGCGSVMRAYPFGLMFSNDIERAGFWAAEHSKLTHRDPIALAACATMAVGMVHMIEGTGLEDTISAMVEAAKRYSTTTGDMIYQAAEDARDGADPHTVLQRLQGWAAHEAIAAAVYVCVRHPNDFKAAILEAANTPGDSDSIATLAGALLGARLGVEAIPREWIRDVERGAELVAFAHEALMII